MFQKLLKLGNFLSFLIVRRTYGKTENRRTMKTIAANVRGDLAAFQILFAD